MTALLGASIGMAVAGPWGALVAVAITKGTSAYRRRQPTPGVRSILLVLLVELQSGQSVLAALRQAAETFPDHHELVRSVRVAGVNGLQYAVDSGAGEVGKVLAHLARAQRSGAPAARIVRTLLDADIAADRAARLARAKSLPVKLMIPVSLLLLPGLLLITYAPALLRLLGDMTGPVIP